MSLLAELILIDEVQGCDLCEDLAFECSNITQVARDLYGLFRWYKDCLDAERFVVNKLYDCKINKFKISSLYEIGRTIKILEEEIDHKMEEL